MYPPSSSRFGFPKGPVALALLAGLLALGTPGRAQQSREYDVKAAFLYNFALFIDWPASSFPQPGSPFVIGVLGTDPFGTSLDEMISGERAKGRPIVIKRLAGLDGLAGCHIVFIGASEQRRLPEILRHCRNRSILTVSEAPGFAEAGGGIGFVTDNRVSLKVNSAALRQAGLNASVKLLRLAQVVGDGARP